MIYNLEFLPISLEDMINIVKYISIELKNPCAADELADKLINPANNLVFSPYINAVYKPLKPIFKEYRKLIVGNYIMFYYIEQDIKKVVVTHVIYKKTTIFQEFHSLCYFLFMVVFFMFNNLFVLPLIKTTCFFK